jgi:hypothetical protein
MFSEAPTLNARTRVLHRLLNIHKHQPLSREQWFGFGGLQPHTEGHLSSTDSTSIIGAYVSARFRTGTDLSSYQVLTLFCAVSTITQNRTLPLTTSLATYQLSLHISSGRSDAWDKLSRCSVTYEPLLQSKCICYV